MHESHKEFFLNGQWMAPGFIAAETYDTVVKIVSLPPFHEGNREQIEAEVRPIDTIRSNIKIEKSICK